MPSRRASAALPASVSPQVGGVHGHQGRGVGELEPLEPHRQFAWRGLGDLAEHLEHLGGALGGPHQASAVQARRGVQVDLDGGDQGEVASAAAQRPEQVGVARGVDPCPAAVGVDDVEGADRVGRPAVGATEPGQAAAQGVADHADAGHAAGQAGQAVRCRGSLHLFPADSRAEAGGAPVGVHLHAAEAAGAQQDDPVGVAGGAVTVGLGGHGQAGAAGVAHQGGDVVGVGGLHHGGHRLLHRQVPGAGRCGETVVAGTQHGTADRGGEVGCGHVGSSLLVVSSWPVGSADRFRHGSTALTGRGQRR